MYIALITAGGHSDTVVSVGPGERPSFPPKACGLISRALRPSFTSASRVLFHLTLSRDLLPHTIASFESHLSRIQHLRISLLASRFVRCQTTFPHLHPSSNLNIETPLTKAGNPPTTPTKLSKQWLTSHPPRKPVVD